MGLEILDALFPASYNFIPFNATAGTRIGGRKTVKHNIPNSDIQVIEDLGKKTPEYHLSAILPGPLFRVRRTALLLALEADISGLLIHPNYGPVLNVSVKSYEITESMEYIGYAEVAMVFELSEGDGRLTAAETLVNVVSGAAKTVKGVVNDISG